MKFSEFLMDLDCLLEIVSISHLSDHQKLIIVWTKRNNNISKMTQILPDFWLSFKRVIVTFCD